MQEEEEAGEEEEEKDEPNAAKGITQCTQRVRKRRLNEGSRPLGGEEEEEMVTRESCVLLKPPFL